MKERPVFTVIAGINGAGKTSLYYVLRESRPLGERVNLDELILRMGGGRDDVVRIRAGRTAAAMIARYIREGRSFHLETTLPGTAIVRQIRTAADNGFRIRLYFVGVDDVETAVERVRRRMATGGHGIDERFIRKRYLQLTEHLRQVLPLCDEAVFFDNSVRFRQIAVMRNEHLIDCDRDLPCWFIDLIDGFAD